MPKRLIGTFKTDPDGFVHLWHYTCPHAAARIRAAGLILPLPQFHLGGMPAIWLADYNVRKPGGEHPSRALGFPWPRPHDECDKTAGGIRVRIHERQLEFWPDLKKEFPQQWEQSLAHRSSKPWLWWITTKPIYLTPEKPCD